MARRERLRGPLVLTLVGFAMLTLGGWLGGAIVFTHGMRVLKLVDEPASVQSRRSRSGEGRRRPDAEPAATALEPADASPRLPLDRALRARADSDFAGSPFSNMISIGIETIPYRSARLCSSSMFTLTIFTLSACSSPILSSTGAMAWHGPHHSAQKSTITGFSLWSTSCSKVSFVHCNCHSVIPFASS